MKKKIAMMTALLFLGAGTGAAYAYLTAGQEVQNEVFAADTGIGITEEYTPPDELQPGLTIRKAPSVTSRSDQPCYVRVMVRFSDSAAEEFCEPLQISEGWTLQEDGYYYLDEILNPGETTDPLFQTVQIREDAAAQSLKQFEILVYAEAVAWKGQSAREAWNLMDGA